MSFHDDKLWQEAFTALLDLLEATEDKDNVVVDECQRLGVNILTETANAVSRRKRPNASNVISLRSLLSVLWAKELVSDEEFNKLDSAYETLANKLPR